MLGVGTRVWTKQQPALKRLKIIMSYLPVEVNDGWSFVHNCQWDFHVFSWSRWHSDSSNWHLVGFICRTIKSPIHSQPRNTSSKESATRKRKTILPEEMFTFRTEFVLKHKKYTQFYNCDNLILHCSFFSITFTICSMPYNCK